MSLAIAHNNIALVHNSERVLFVCSVCSWHSFDAEDILQSKHGQIVARTANRPALPKLMNSKVELDRDQFENNCYAAKYLRRKHETECGNSAYFTAKSFPTWIEFNIPILLLFTSEFRGYFGEDSLATQSNTLLLKISFQSQDDSDETNN